ncbi:MAG: zinc ribbon domain-containing protein, partial [Nitrospirae bacterium]|nr:zinc ribbon domain-containing protein [Nitrospirota bacterium]
MPIYEYIADRCDRRPVCSRRKQYIQRLSDPPETACRECGAPVRKVMSSFAARSGAVGVSSPDPTGLNITGIPAPS